MSKFSMFRVFSILAALPMFWCTSIQAAAISFSTPAANQAYATGASIEFSGEGSWVKSGPNAESETKDVSVDLMWFATTTSALSTGVICDSVSAVIDYALDGNNQKTGAYTFENPEANGKSSLVARQTNGNFDTYRLIATPERQHGPYHVPNSDDVHAERQLGVIS